MSLSSSFSSQFETSAENILTRAIESTKLFVKVIAELNSFVLSLHETYRTTRRKQDVELLKLFNTEIRTMAWQEIMAWLSMVRAGSDDLCSYPPIGDPLTPHVLRILFEIFDVKFIPGKEGDESKESKEQKSKRESLLEIMCRLKKCLEQMFPQLLAIHAKKFKKENDQLALKASTILNNIDEIIRLQKEDIVSTAEQKINKTHKIQEQLLELLKVGNSGTELNNRFNLTLISPPIPEAECCVVS